MAVSDKASAMTQTEESPLLYLNNLNNDTCIICLEEEYDGIKKGKIVLPSAIPFLKKNCHCHFYIHTDCFNLWFSNKPVCPICSTLLSYSDDDSIIIEPPPPVYTELTTYNYAPSNYIASIEDSYKRKIICFFIFLITSYFIFNVISN